MESRIDTIFSMIILVLGWSMYLVIFLSCIRIEARKRWRKNERLYPYFHYPWYKKMFLLGLKGALHPFHVVTRFMWNISMLIMLCSGICVMIFPNIIVGYICRINGGLYLISMFLDVPTFPRKVFN